MRLEGNEAVEQGLDHVAPLVLMARLAGADIVDGEALGAGLLDLMLEQKGAGRQTLQLSVGQRAQHAAHAAMAHRPAEGGQHLAVHFEIAEPEPARIVALEQRELAIEGAGMGVEDIVTAHGGELTGLLRKQRLDQLKPLIARLGPAIGEGPSAGELRLLEVEHAPRALAEPLLVERREIAEA